MKVFFILTTMLLFGCDFNTKSSVDFLYSSSGQKDWEWQDTSAKDIRGIRFYKRGSFEIYRISDGMKKGERISDVVFNREWKIKYNTKLYLGGVVFEILDTSDQEIYLFDYSASKTKILKPSNTQKDSIYRQTSIDLLF